jgi:hypothetical protein
MSEENYFKFPLAMLQGLNRNSPTPHDILEDALCYGTINAGIGFKKINTDECYDKLLEEAWEDVRQSIGFYYNEIDNATKNTLVGTWVCQVTLSTGSILSAPDIHKHYSKYVFPLVTLRADIFWSAYHQVSHEEGKEDHPPEKGISWREFRILCAILSVKKNREGFSFIGWQEIQARSCGMLRADYKAARKIPSHLAPPYSQKQIKRTCDRLEALGFFARCRHSKGKRGGWMAYSFKHSPEELRAAVSRWASFRRGDSVRENRAKDLSNSLKTHQKSTKGIV